MVGAHPHAHEEGVGEGAKAVWQAHSGTQEPGISQTHDIAMLILPRA